MREMDVGDPAVERDTSGDNVRLFLRSSVLVGIRDLRPGEEIKYRILKEESAVNPHEILIKIQAFSQLISFTAPGYSQLYMAYWLGYQNLESQ